MTAMPPNYYFITNKTHINALIAETNSPIITIPKLVYFLRRIISISWRNVRRF
jgi:hypothetical protein